MSNDTNNGGPAFPGQWYDFQPLTGEQVVREQWGGMTLRDYFAAQALPAVLAQKDVHGHIREWENAAWISYQIADTMLKKREASND